MFLNRAYILFKKNPASGGVKGQKLKIIRINNNPQQLSKDIKIFIYIKRKEITIY